MQSALLPARRRVALVVTLLILAPVIAEVLFGSTPLTRLVFLIPQIGAYGCGALIIRALVRYQGKGWTAILLLVIAYALAEECVILQTSFYPLFANPQHIYGRALGVNWIYLLWALGYESVWSIVLPIRNLATTCWIFREVDDSGMCLPWEILLGAPQHPLA